ncbi:MAG: glycosyltransferase, partial [Bacteroidetes bacterium]|nr:glycosyltransferase [Bacteroidota bacterium]
MAAKTGALLSQFKLIRIHAGDSLMAPKKNALNEAIKVAGGEILLFTDADCRPPSTWISSMVA